MAGLIESIAKVAPFLGKVLGSPFASIGLSLLTSLFGVHQDDLERAILNDPEAYIKIKELEAKHLEMLTRLAVVDAEDRKDARARERDLRDWVPTILAIGFLVNYGAIQFWCVTHPATATDVISARFQDVLIMIISYYFGSTHTHGAQK